MAKLINEELDKFLEEYPEDGRNKQVERSNAEGDRESDVCPSQGYELFRSSMELTRSNGVKKKKGLLTSVFTRRKAVEGECSSMEKYGTRDLIQRIFEKLNGSSTKTRNDSVPKKKDLKVKINDSNVTVTPTLLGLTSSLYRWKDFTCCCKYLLEVYFHIYIEGLDSWLFEGTLDDPFGELFFTANQSVSVNDAEFWEKSYMLMRVPGPKSSVTLLNEKKGLSGNDSSSISDKDKEQNNRVLCPLFIKDICKSIVSAGKSLQLMQHIPTSSETSVRIQYHGRNGFGNSGCGVLLPKKNNCRSTADLSLSEIFCLTLAGLIGHGDHVSRYLWKDEADEWEISPTLASYISGELENDVVDKDLPLLTCSERMWYKLLVGAVQEKRAIGRPNQNTRVHVMLLVLRTKKVVSVSKRHCRVNSVMKTLLFQYLKWILRGKKNAWNVLNLSYNYCLPSLNDESFLSAVFEGSGVVDAGLSGTNYKFGFQFGKSEYLLNLRRKNFVETL